VEILTEQAHRRAEPAEFPQRGVTSRFFSSLLVALHEALSPKDFSRKGSKAQSATAFPGAFFAPLREKYSLPQKSPPEAIQVFLYKARSSGLAQKVIARTVAALPPDLRRGYASPLARSKQMGLRPWSGLRPKVFGPKAERGA
jgi:hypothetical protein